MSHINTRRQGKPRRTACAIVRKKGKTFNKLKDMTRHRKAWTIIITSLHIHKEKKKKIFFCKCYTYYSLLYKTKFFNRLLSLNVYSLE